MAVASTVVLLRALEERGQVNSPDGRIAVGWRLVEDLAMVLALVLLPAFAGSLGGQASTEAESLLLTVTTTVLEIGVFIALMLIVSARLLPWLLNRVVGTGSRESFTWPSC